MQVTGENKTDISSSVQTITLPVTLANMVNDSFDTKFVFLNKFFSDSLLVVINCTWQPPLDLR